MMHVVFTATAYAFADTKHNLNQDDQAKTCIAHTVFGSNKANLKSEEEPKQLPGLETSTMHFLNAKDSDGSSMEKKVEYALYAKSVLMMQMPDKRFLFIYGSRLVRSNSTDRTKHMEKYLRDATQEVSNDTLVYNSSSLSRKAIQPHLTSASVKTGSLRPFRSGVMNLNQGPRRDYSLRRNRAPIANEVYDTSGRNSLRLAQRSTTSMQLTP